MTPWLAVLALAGAAWAAPEPAPVPTAAEAGGLTGRVTAAAAPLASAWVYAYQIADFRLERVATDQQGGFLFDPLPAGLYKIIAYKAGFVPAVVMLSRATAQARQFLDLELQPLPAEADEDDFWALRERIPSDVLRDIQIAESWDPTAEPALAGMSPGPFDGGFRGQMQATAGVREGLEYGAAHVSGGEVDLDGRMGELKIGVEGRYSELDSERLEQGASGHTQWLSLQVESADTARVDVTSWMNQLDTFRSGDPDSVAFESHSVSWTHQVGAESHSRFTAHYTAQSNFYRQGLYEPADIPTASRSLRLEGSYTTPLSERATLQAGFRYRDLENEFRRGRRGFSVMPRETVEVFGRGGLEVKPAVVVEYGLYSKLRDGGVSLYPQGGVIVRLGDHWQASTLASHRVLQDVEDELPGDFTPVFHSESSPCSLGEEYCYQVMLSRLWAGDQSVSFGATHRQFGETLRMYFDRDFFNRLESLFVVEGDRLPELHFGITRRLSPAILTRLESNLAAGGGGIVHAANRRSYENQLRYMVTSLDTQFEQTETGIFVAFHRLEQQLNPLQTRRRRQTYPEVELERLQLLLTQDLGILHDLAWDWAVHLNMELSRGSTPDSALSDEELRKRLTGGIAFRF